MLLSCELIGHKQRIRARSEAGLSRLPVTEEIAGSNPVGPATFATTKKHPIGCFFYLSYKFT